MICNLCPHKCDITEQNHGMCKTKTVKDGRIECLSYGHVTSVGLDPIEKKPLYNFMPGSNIFSIGFWGCNMTCPWCQNDSISRGPAKHFDLSPREVVKEAIYQKRYGNIGVAYTYNEPLTNYDFVYDTAVLVRKEDLKNVVVTNGMIEDSYLIKLLPYIDAFNIDLKTIDAEKYTKIGGNLNTVLNTIRKAAKSSHVEVTTLIVPGFNDTPEEIIKISETLAEIDKSIPLHVSRFFPYGEMKNSVPTDVGLIYHLKELAEKNLEYVYAGNCW